MRTGIVEVAQWRETMHAAGDSQPGDERGELRLRLEATIGSSHPSLVKLLCQFPDLAERFLLTQELARHHEYEMTANQAKHVIDTFDGEVQLQLASPALRRLYPCVSDQFGIRFAPVENLPILIPNDHDPQEATSGKVVGGEGTQMMELAGFYPHGYDDALLIIGSVLLDHLVWLNKPDLSVSDTLAAEYDHLLDPLEKYIGCIRAQENPLTVAKSMIDIIPEEELNQGTRLWLCVATLSLEQYELADAIALRTVLLTLQALAEIEQTILSQYPNKHDRQFLHQNMPLTEVRQQLRLQRDQLLDTLWREVGSDRLKATINNASYDRSSKTSDPGV